MNMLEYKIRRLCRHFKYWLIKKMCTQAEWQTLRNIRAGYYGYFGKKEKMIPITTSFELNQASYEFLHSADGEAEYDAQYGIAHKLIRDCEDEIAQCVSYIEAWDEKKQMWICTAELNLVEVIKE